MTRWEYKNLVIQSTYEGTVTNYLREYGNEGWELVSVIMIERDRIALFFKRPLLQEVVG
jgi:hypothetical protein